MNLILLKFKFMIIKHKTDFYGLGFLLSLAGYLGVNMVLTLVRVAGAFAAVTVKYSYLTLKDNRRVE